MIDALALLQGHPGLQALAVALFGLVIGSFLNVVIHRVPRMMEAEWQAQCAEIQGTTPPQQTTVGLLWPPSRCPGCGGRIRAWQNIPLLSYAWLRGRCAACGESISARYPLVEATTAVLSVVVVLVLGWNAAGAAGLVFTYVLIAATGIDLEHYLLPDGLTLSLLWLGLLLATGTLYVGPMAAILGAAAGYSLLWGVYQAFRILTGKEGMGYGDFKLLAAIGAWVGWQALPLVIILASAVGAAVGIAMIAGLGHHRDHPIPFGPYLAAAGWITLLWGEDLMEAYLRFSGLK